VPTASRRRDRDSGQALVVMLGVILAAVALVALIVDGGNLFTQQRITQTGGGCRIGGRGDHPRGAPRRSVGAQRRLGRRDQ